ncbi:MAG: hypothetical protein V3U92_10020 [Cellulophaga sp.]
MLISSMMEDIAPSLEAEVKKITDKPIRYVLSIDSDPYNHHANKYFSDRGATIYSHENLLYTKAYTEIRFSNHISIPIGDEIVTAYHSPTHQFDHIDVHLEKSNVIFMSDGFKGYWLTPHGPNGLKGLLESFDKAISLSDEKTIIVSGNTSKNPKLFLSNKKRLIEIRKKHVDFTNRIGVLYKQGLNAEEIAKDDFIQDIMKSFKVYPKFKKWVSEEVQTVLESDFSNPIELSKKELQKYTGFYKLDENIEIEIFLKEGRLIARSVGQFMFELTALSKVKFDFKTDLSNNYITFQFLPNGKIKSLTTVLEGWLAGRIKAGVHTKK